MKFESLLQIVGDEPVFETALLFAGGVDPAQIQRQVAGWTRRGWLHQLRRGLYALAPPFRKVEAHPYLISNRLVPGSYVSLQSALSLYGLIPEAVPVTTAVGPGRPAAYDTPLGSFLFHHEKPELSFGYRQVELGHQTAPLVALPEKALLDLVHLTPLGDRPEYLTELRLQNLEQLDMERLERFARRFERPKLRRAVQSLRCLAEGQDLEVLEL